MRASAVFAKLVACVPGARRLSTILYPSWSPNFRPNNLALYGLIRVTYVINIVMYQGIWCSLIGVRAVYMVISKF